MAIIPISRYRAIRAALMVAIYFGGCLGRPPVQIAADPVESSPLWQRALGGRALGAPAVLDDTVTLVCDGGNLKRFTQEGRFLWDYFARGRLLPFLTLSREGASYICRTNGTVIAVNPGGKEIWQRSLGEPLIAPVLCGWDGRLFLATANRIRCYTASGYLLWTEEFAEPFALPPCDDRAGGLLALLTNNELLEIDPFGAVQSRRLANRPALLLAIEVPPDSAGTAPTRAALAGEAPGQSGLGFPEREILAIYDNGAVHSYKPLSMADDGQEYRSLPSLGGRPVAGISRGGYAALALTSGRALLISANGPLWSAPLPIGIGSSEAAPALVFDERGVYILSQSGAAGYTREGELLWSMELQGAAATPGFNRRGYLFSGGLDWILNAYRVEERVLREALGPVASQGSSYYGGDPRPSSWDGSYFQYREDSVREELDRIGSLIRSNTLGSKEPESMAYLMEIADSQWGPGSLSLPVQSRYRREALALLGYIGNRDTVPLLAAIFARDREPIVKAAAAEAIGRIGSDPHSAALQGFRSQVGRGPDQDQQLLVAIVMATGSLCRFSGPPLAEQGIQLLATLSGPTWPTLVRTRAQQELRSLR